MTKKESYLVKTGWKMITHVCIHCVLQISGCHRISWAWVANKSMWKWIFAGLVHTGPAKSLSHWYCLSAHGSTYDWHICQSILQNIGLALIGPNSQNQPECVAALVAHSWDVHSWHKFCHCVHLIAPWKMTLLSGFLQPIKQFTPKYFTYI